MESHQRDDRSASEGRAPPTAGHAPGDLLRELRRANPRYQAHWIGWRLKPLDSADIIDALTLRGNILYEAGYRRRPALEAQFTTPKIQKTGATIFEGGFKPS